MDPMMLLAGAGLGLQALGGAANTGLGLIPAAVSIYDRWRMETNPFLQEQVQGSQDRYNAAMQNNPWGDPYQTFQGLGQQQVGRIGNMMDNNPAFQAIPGFQNLMGQQRPEMQNASAGLQGLVGSPGFQNAAGMQQPPQPQQPSTGGMVTRPQGTPPGSPGHRGFGSPTSMRPPMAPLSPLTMPQAPSLVNQLAASPTSMPESVQQQITNRATEGIDQNAANAQRQARAQSAGRGFSGGGLLDRNLMNISNAQMAQTAGVNRDVGIAAAQQNMGDLRQAAQLQLGAGQQALGQGQLELSQQGLSGQLGQQQQQFGLQQLLGMGNLGLGQGQLELSGQQALAGNMLQQEGLRQNLWGQDIQNQGNLLNQIYRMGMEGQQRDLGLYGQLQAQQQQAMQWGGPERQQALGQQMAMLTGNPIAQSPIMTTGPTMMMPGYGGGGGGGGSNWGPAIAGAVGQWAGAGAPGPWN